MRIVILAALLLTLPRGGAGPAHAGSPDPAGELRALLDEGWERDMRENPTWASSLGDRRYNHLWPDRSLEAHEARHQADREMLARIEAIDASGLDRDDRLNHVLFRKRYADRIAGHRFRTHLMPVRHRGGLQTLNELTESLRFANVPDYEDWIARLVGVDEYVDQHIALLTRGLKERRVQPRVLMERVPEQLRSQLVADPEDSPFYAVFLELPDEFDEGTRDRLHDAARSAIAESVLPAYRRFASFFEKEYLPHCRETVGVWDLPDGREYYAHRVRLMTTTDLTSEQIHAIGLEEVSRIREEMEEIIAEVEFEGTFQEFLVFLRTDPQFYYDDPDELFDAYLATCKRIDPALVKLFGKLPRMPYGLRPIPDVSAPHTTTAYYNGPAADGSRPGYYYVNLYRPEVRPKYEIEVLSVHEAVPGHHLQIALAHELGELPRFRRYGGYTAFVEGWGLYSESLGDELGLYRDPYSKFGQLTYEMWRAVRLVVDTGLHHLKWDRDRAIEFFKANAAKTEHDIVNEIDRYIGTPGQALAYKIGELKIQELRDRARTRLGERFDIRAFHDVVLGSGAVPLDVLERLVEEHIESSSR